MPTSIEDIESAIQDAVTGGFRERLVDKGEARAMIWQEGELPDGSPRFPAALTYDLTSYAYSLLSMGLRLREQGGNTETARVAFERAAVSLESILIKGDADDQARGFHFVIAAAAYHLGRFSARAYSILMHGKSLGAFSPIERCLMNLMLRNFRQLEREVISYRVYGAGTDANIEARLKERFDQTADDQFLEDDSASPVSDALSSAVIDTFLAGIGLFIFAIERGERSYVDAAIERLKLGFEVCAEMNLLPQWWIFRLTIHIIDDLWETSFHERLPLLPNNRTKLSGRG